MIDAVIGFVFLLAFLGLAIFAPLVKQRIRRWQSLRRLRPYQASRRQRIAKARATGRLE